MNTKGRNTGFKDCNGKEILVGDKVYEGCNGLTSTVVWDPTNGTYKLDGLGDYYIKDASIEWEVIESVCETDDLDVEY